MVILHFFLKPSMIKKNQGSWYTFEEDKSRTKDLYIAQIISSCTTRSLMLLKSGIRKDPSTHTVAQSRLCFLRRKKKHCHVESSDNITVAIASIYARQCGRNYKNKRIMAPIMLRYSVNSANLVPPETFCSTALKTEISRRVCIKWWNTD